MKIKAVKFQNVAIWQEITPLQPYFMTVWRQISSLQELFTGVSHLTCKCMAILGKKKKLFY